MKEAGAQTKTGPARAADTRKMVLLALFAAVAYVVMLVGRVPVVLFLKYDPKDVIIAIGGFIYGPLSALAVSVVVSLVEMFTVSDTGFIGLVMNVLSTCSFACTAALIYKRGRSLTGAVIGLAAGALLATAVMMLWNYLVTPVYMRIPRETVAAMLLPAFLPFNLLKGGLNAAFTLLLYKPLVTALRGAHLIPEGDGAPAGGGRLISPGVLWLALGLLATCVLSLLVLWGVI